MQAKLQKPLAIFSRDYVSSRIGSEVFGRKVKTTGETQLLLSSIIVENDFVPRFIRIELFVFTLRSSRGIEMRVEGEIHVTRDREARRAYVYEGRDKISTLEISIFPFP